MYQDKTLLITGGTGSFGNAILRRFLDSSIKEIRIFSRDEKKQEDIRQAYNNPKIKCYIGDVRDRFSVARAMDGVDYVFHAAALKQVPSCEFYPMEAVLTNVHGTQNTLDAAINAGVKRVVCLSTDKAVYPINAMGISKAMMERVMVAASRPQENRQTVICATRYGNVMASRGSVIPLFLNQILSNKDITITNPSMTRFMMTLDNAVDLVLFAFEHGNNGDIFVQKSPAASIGLLADAILSLMKKHRYPVTTIGTRHGEKLYESLLTQEELNLAEDLGNYFRIPSDNRDLNYSQFIDSGEKYMSDCLVDGHYSSHNARQLDLESMKSLLLELRLMQQVLDGNPPTTEG